MPAVNERALIERRRSTSHGSHATQRNPRSGLNGNAAIIKARGGQALDKRSMSHTPQWSKRKSGKRERPDTCAGRSVATTTMSGRKFEKVRGEKKEDDGGKEEEKEERKEEVAELRQKTDLTLDAEWTGASDHRAPPSCISCQ